MTLRVMALVTGLLMAFRPACSQPPAAADLQSLYKAGKWAELRAAVSNTKGNALSALYSGATAVVFNEDAARSEKALRSVINAAPHSDAAYEAYEWLSHAFLRTGQYRRLMAVMEERWAGFPDKRDRAAEQAALAGFRGLPDQVTVKTRPSVLPHEKDSIFIPLTVNGTSAEFFFDTGAGLSALSESEARRLGLHISETSGTMGTTTSKSAFHTAVAKDVVVGGLHLRNVSFTVFPDNQEPWSHLQPGRQGIIGIPVILAFGTLRWVRNGAMEIGGKPGRLNAQEANLRFEGDHLALAVTVEGLSITGSLDTGAIDTDLFEGFARQFAPMLNTAGKKETMELKGIGGTETLEAIRLPDLKFTIAGRDTVLSPARVMPGKSWFRCCVANIGMDLLTQADAFKIDFRAMKLELEVAK